MRVEPYLMFSGRCEEALGFYQTAIGAQPVMVMRFKESPEPPHMPLPPGWSDKIMHCGFMPMEATFWSPCFGMCTDRFGVNWMVGVDGPQA